MVREPVLSPFDRVSELFFSPFMAPTLVGAVSVAESGLSEQPNEKRGTANTQFAATK